MDANQLSQAQTAFKRAIFVLGGQARMAELLGLSQQGVSLRLRQTTPPTKSAAEMELIEQATGVSRHDLRPDLYPLDIPAPAAPAPLAQHPAGQPPASPPRPPLSEEAGGSSSADPLNGIAA